MCINSVFFNYSGMIRNFLILFLSITCLSATPIVKYYDCDDIKVEVEIRQVKNGKNNVQLNVSNAEKPIHILFFKESGELLSNDYKSGKIILSEKGTFHYAVVDGKGCRVTSTFNVKDDE